MSTLMSGLAGGVMASCPFLTRQGLSMAFHLTWEAPVGRCGTEGRSVEQDRFDIDGRQTCLPSVQVETLSAGGHPGLG